MPLADEQQEKSRVHVVGGVEQFFIDKESGSQASSFPVHYQLTRLGTFPDAPSGSLQPPTGTNRKSSSLS